MGVVGGGLVLVGGRGEEYCSSVYIKESSLPALQAPGAAGPRSRAPRRETDVCRRLRAVCSLPQLSLPSGFLSLEARALLAARDSWGLSGVWTLR